MPTSESYKRYYDKNKDKTFYCPICDKDVKKFNINRYHKRSTEHIAYNEIKSGKYDEILNNDDVINKMLMLYKAHTSYKRIIKLLSLPVSQDIVKYIIKLKSND